MRFAKGLAPLMAGLMLVGCSSAPEKAPAPEPTLAESAAPEFDNPALPAGPIIRNPYLESPSPKVSAEVANAFARAQRQMQNQQWSGARQTLQQLVVQAPELSGPWLNLGIVWVQLNEPGQARAAFERALAANPLNVDAYNHLGALERREGNFTQAQNNYEQALKVWPHSVAAHKNLGILLDIYTGDWPQALVHYQAAQIITEQTQGEPDATLNGWIIDLQRRIKAGEGV